MAADLEFALAPPDGLELREREAMFALLRACYDGVDPERLPYYFRRYHPAAESARGEAANLLRPDARFFGTAEAEPSALFRALAARRAGQPRRAA